MKIKVIKKKNLKGSEKTPFVSETGLRRKAENKMVSTVSDWVNEFQTRRLEETNQAFEQLYSQRLQNRILG